MRMAWLLLILAFTFGCGKPAVVTNAPPRNASIACFGDSLVEGVGASSAKTTYPAQLGSMLGLPVVNLGQRGDTTADSVRRLAEFANSDYGIIIVTLGGNDILQRVHWDTTVENLRKIFAGLQETGAVVVFTGVTGPLNMTRDKHYGKLCEASGVLYVSEILNGVFGNSELMSDGIHPNDAGYERVAVKVAEALRVAQFANR